MPLSIYLGKHMQTKEEVAIKKMPRYKKQENGDNHDNITLIKSEIKIFKKLHHPYICKMFYTTFDTEENYYIITEKCEDLLLHILINQDIDFLTHIKQIFIKNKDS